MAKPAKKTEGGARERQRLIVALGFAVNEVGEFEPVGQGEQCQSEDAARRAVARLAAKHAGAIAWARDADPMAGEYGEPTVIARSGRVPENID